MAAVYGPAGRIGLTVLSVMAAGYATMAGAPLIGDEVFHHDQVRRFMRGEVAMTPGLTTFPGYHALMAACGLMAGTDSPALLRGVQALLSSAAVAVFYGLATRLRPEAPGWTTLQLLTLPVVFPYFFLLYTDVLALLLLLAAVHLAAFGRVRLGTAVGTLAILVRQTSVVWLAFLCAFVFLTRHRGRPWRSALRGWLAECGIAFGAFASFALFVTAHGGVAVGDPQSHRPGLHLTNLWVLLTLAALFLLPAHLAALLRPSRAIAWRRTALVLGVTLVLYGLTLANTHPYNSDPGEYLRNALLAQVTSSAWARAVFFVPVALTLAALVADPPRPPLGVALGVTTVVLLGSTWLVEPRYYIPSFAFFLLARPYQSARVEAAIVALQTPLAALLLVGIHEGRFFP